MELQENGQLTFMSDGKTPNAISWSFGDPYLLATMFLCNFGSFTSSLLPSKVRKVTKRATVTFWRNCTLLLLLLLQGCNATKQVINKVIENKVYVTCWTVLNLINYVLHFFTKCRYQRLIMNHDTHQCVQFRYFMIQPITALYVLKTLVARVS